MKLAAECGVDKSPLFLSAARRYVDQVAIIDRIKAELDAQGLVIEHVNVRGGVNIEAHPLAATLPKHVDAANRTLTVMLAIIKEHGVKAPGSRLQEMMFDLND